MKKDWFGSCRAFGNFGTYTTELDDLRDAFLQKDVRKCGESLIRLTNLGVFRGHDENFSMRLVVGGLKGLMAFGTSDRTLGKCRSNFFGSLVSLSLI